MKTDPVVLSRPLDERVPGRHIGLIALDCDQVTERDFMNMRPDNISFYTSRIPYGEANTLENLKTSGKHLSESASLISTYERLDAIAYSCTSGTMALGYAGVARKINQVHPNVPVVTPMTAAFRAFEHMGISSVSLLTPYRQNVADLMMEHVAENGFSVLNSTSFLLQNSSDLPRLSLESIVAGAKETCRDGADALFISCTGIRAVDVLERLEGELGKPVFTSNQCMLWECLKYAGYSRPVNGFGRLLRAI